MCKAKAVEPAAMQEVGVFDERDQSKTRLDPGSFHILRQDRRGPAQRRQADSVDTGKSVRGLDTRTARAKTAARHAAMAVQQHRTAEDAVAPQARHDIAERKRGIDQPAG